MRQLIAAFALAASFAPAAHATNFFDGFDGSGGPNGSNWQTSSWSNGSPFGCTFAYSEVWLAGNSNLVLNVNSSVPSAVKCAEIRTWQSFTYGKFVVRMPMPTRYSRSSVPVMLVSTTCLASLNGLSRKPWPRPWPALATSTSTGRPATASISLSTPNDVDRSASTASTFAPSARKDAAASSRGPWSAAITRSCPSCAASRASSRPMPEDAPVTTARGRSGFRDAMTCSCDG